MPQVSVIIVSFNSREDVLACLSSLLESMKDTSLEVIVVDNGSTDDSPAQIASHFPEVKLFAQHENLGFARACNVGMSHASGRHILLLNPDTEVRGNAIETLGNLLDEHPNWGIVGPQMIDQHDQVYSAARRLPTVWRLFCETIGLSVLFPRSALVNGYLYGECDREELERVEQIEGSALMISDAARATVGDLDLRFFIFFEEVDWCKRVADAGFEIRVVKDATVMHRRSTTMSKFFIFSRQARAQSAMQYFLKHDGKFGLFKLRTAMCLTLPLRAIMLLPLTASGKKTLRTKFAATIAEIGEFAGGIRA